MHEPQAVNGVYRNPNVHHERTDVNSRAVLWFAGGLTVSLIVILLIILGVFQIDWNREIARKKSRFPMALDDRLPPEPRLEGLAVVDSNRSVGRMDTEKNRPQHDLGRTRASAARLLRDEQERALTAPPTWLENEKTARIPIEEAMKRIVDRLPARSRDQANKSRGEPSPSNSGREPNGGRQ